MRLLQFQLSDWTQNQRYLKDDNWYRNVIDKENYFDCQAIGLYKRPDRVYKISAWDLWSIWDIISLLMPAYLNKTYPISDLDQAKEDVDKLIVKVNYPCLKAGASVVDRSSTARIKPTLRIFKAAL